MSSVISEYLSFAPLYVKSLKYLFENNGFIISEKHYVPVPWNLVFGNNAFSKLLININKLFCSIWPSLFAYQFYFIIKMKPHLDYLLISTQKPK